MANSTDGFGDPRLTNLDLAPLSLGQRDLSTPALCALWLGLAVGPATYSAALGTTSLGAAMVLLLISLLVATALIGALSGTVGRYGIGAPVLFRVALGARGVLPVLLVRWLAGAWFAGHWALVIGAELRAVLLAATTDLPGLHDPLALTLERSWGAPADWFFAALLVAGAGVLGATRSRVLAAVRLLAPLALGLGTALVVWGGITSKGYGDTLVAPAPLGIAAAVSQFSTLLAATLLAVLSAADWHRFAIAKGTGQARSAGGNKGEPKGPSRLLFLLTPLSQLPLAVLVAFFALLLARAAQVVGGSNSGAAGLDAMHFAGPAAGVVGVLWDATLFLLATPLVIFYSGGLALSALAPRALGRRQASTWSWILALLLLPALRFAQAQAPVGAWLTACLASLIGIALADELIVRRGRLLLEEAYLMSQTYGPVAGISPAGLAALVGGTIIASPMLGAALELLGVGAATLGVAASLGAWLGTAVAFVTFATLAPLERGVRRAALALLGRDNTGTAAKVRVERSGKRRKTESTDPHFVYTPSDSAATSTKNEGDGQGES